MLFDGIIHAASRIGNAELYRWPCGGCKPTSKGGGGCSQYTVSGIDPAASLADLIFIKTAPSIAAKLSAEAVLVLG